MGSLVADSIFISIPLEVNIDVCANTLFENNERVEGLSKIEFNKLLSLATKESYFVLNKKLYRQVHGVVMGSCVGLTLANVFLVYFEKNLLQNCPFDF